jgi:hypothetical protein
MGSVRPSRISHAQRSAAPRRSNQIEIPVAGDLEQILANFGRLPVPSSVAVFARTALDLEVAVLAGVTPSMKLISARESRAPPLST